ncbi:MAG: imidazolonepropionase [Cardiobacteriaceae bacterium]|nr:imidazolonepropionase [Cardiobacteriaceae bacterium]
MQIWLGHLATMTGNDYGTIENGAIAVEDGKIVWLGKREDAAGQIARADAVHDMGARWITPALIDCHTHLVYGGNRSNEFEARLNGVSYTDIAKQGGGILASVRATRAASEAELLASALPRLRTLQQEGTGTVEIKSGYGLDLETERKMLRVARALGKETGLTIRTTYLAAHALPPEYAGRADDYIEAVCAWLPELHAEGLVDAVDGFCETIAFSPAQMARVFDAAKALDLPVKLHAEQLSNLEGAALVARYGGLSADHLEYLSPAGIAAMKAAGTVAVLLPGAFYTLRETQLPPVEGLRAAAVPMALSTDSNPGTSPLTSLLLTLNMGCTLFKLTPQEALAGVTRHAARALGLQERKGQLATGMDADLAIWDIERPADLAYRIGFNPLHALILKGNS